MQSLRPHQNALLGALKPHSFGPVFRLMSRGPPKAACKPLTLPKTFLLLLIIEESPFVFSILAMCLQSLLYFMFVDGMELILVQAPMLPEPGLCHLIYYRYIDTWIWV